MPEGRRRGYAAETADASAGAARMRADAAMHRDPSHRLVGPVAGEIASDVFDHPLREQPYRSESAAAEHHLVEGSHCPRRAEPAAMRQAGLAKFGAVVARLRFGRRVDIGTALLLLGRHAQEQLVDEPEGADNTLA